VEEEIDVKPNERLDRRHGSNGPHFGWRDAWTAIETWLWSESVPQYGLDEGSRFSGRRRVSCLLPGPPKPDRRACWYPAAATPSVLPCFT